MTSLTPIRIQLRRTKGWRMPRGAIKVDRTTVWGNRWKVGDWSNTLGRNVETVEEAVDVYRRCMFGPGMEHMVGWARERLRGLDLACWCPLDRCCHADVLLEVANHG